MYQWFAVNCFCLVHLCSSTRCVIPCNYNDCRLPLRQHHLVNTLDSLEFDWDGPWSQRNYCIQMDFLLPRTSTALYVLASTVHPIFPRQVVWLASHQKALRSVIVLLPKFSNSSAKHTGFSDMTKLLIIEQGLNISLHYIENLTFLSKPDKKICHVIYSFDAFATFTDLGTPWPSGTVIL